MITFLRDRAVTASSLVSRSLVMDPPLTDQEFEAFCFANDLVSFERTREGKILLHAPTGLFTSDGNSEIATQLRTWWKTHRRGKVTDSGGGFFLKDGSMLSPDASYVTPERLEGFSKKDLAGFPHFCPDFVIELLSPSDNIVSAQKNMGLWSENGVTLGWLIDPRAKEVFVYQSGREATVVSTKVVHGSGPVEGFTFDLEELWRCYEI